jgi:hypothetical protein
MATLRASHCCLGPSLSLDLALVDLQCAQRGSSGAQLGSGYHKQAVDRDLTDDIFIVIDEKRLPHNPVAF